MKSPIIFVRYGSLNAKKRRKGKKLGMRTGTFHSPPASSGFYAMPKKFISYFLIGSLETTQPNIFSKRYDRKKDNYRQDILKKIKREFTLDNDDLIWSHFTEYADPNEIIEITEHWVLTTFSHYKKMLKRSSMKDRANSLSRIEGKNINSVPKGAGYFSMDHYEVFIPKSL